MKQPAGLPVSLFEELSPEAPLYRAAYRRIRQMILDGALAPGSRLPSTRSLAHDLGMSRNTAEAAFSQLRSEGYITRRVGSGSYVTETLPGLMRHAGRRRNGATRSGALSRATPYPELSRRGRASLSEPPDRDADSDATFGVCRPSLDAFPTATWARLLARGMRRADRVALDEPPAAGVPPLRAAVAEYLAAVRGVQCDASNVIIVNSTQQSLHLAAQLLLDEDDGVWLEEPCYVGASAVFRAARARVVSVPVDDEGMQVDLGVRRAPNARIAYVTPSHQFPLGSTMSLKRRLALLRWAAESKGWIIEDDYDSEFRYDGHPLAALQGLDRAERVLYVGTLNKIMFPALRLAYIVVPSPLVDAFETAHYWLDGCGNSVTQTAMADFITEGHFTAHIRRMREVYRDRRDALCDAVDHYAAGRIRLGRIDTGMHVIGWLPPETDVAALRRRAATEGVHLRDLRPYYNGEPPGPGLVLNFASSSPPNIRGGIRTIARWL